MIFDLNTFFSMDTLIIAALAIVAFLIFDFVRNTIETANIFKKIKNDHEKFLIEYSDCHNLSDMIALYIVRNF
jgi:hypothetical protein